MLEQKVVTHAISETFPAIQGEGRLAGTPSTFVRAAHCNLSCSWCDAAYTWKGDVKFQELTTEEVVERVAHHHVVLTGGEPTIMPGFRSILEALPDSHITVETNGVQSPNVVDPDALVDLWSVSPKLGSSGQVGQLNPEALRDFGEIARFAYDRVQWKFVIDNEQDYTDAFNCLDQVGFSECVPVFLQPNGLCHNARVLVGDGRKSQTKITDGSWPNFIELRPAQKMVVVELDTPYGDRFRWLVEHALANPMPKYHVRVVPQIHKLAYGVKRGH
jgi:organic radical activating enzyme